VAHCQQGGRCAEADCVREDDAAQSGQGQQYPAERSADETGEAGCGRQRAVHGRQVLGGNTGYVNGAAGRLDDRGKHGLAEDDQVHDQEGAGATGRQKRYESEGLNQGGDGKQPPGVDPIDQDSQ